MEFLKGGKCSARFAKLAGQFSISFFFSNLKSAEILLILLRNYETAIRIPIMFFFNSLNCPGNLTDNSA